MQDDKNKYCQKEKERKREQITQGKRAGDPGR